MSNGMCSRFGCENKASWKVILLLRPRNYRGEPVRGSTGLCVCGDHKSKLPDPFITQETWNQILAAFDERKLARPHRILTEVDYETFNEPGGPLEGGMVPFHNSYPPPAPPSGKMIAGEDEEAAP